MAIRSNFPSIKPTLLLDFANTKALDPRITFTRATTATFYDGVTTAKAEENLLTFSEQFDNAAWTNSVTGVAAAPIVTANQGAAPDGFNTADRIQFSLSGGTSSSDITRRGQNFVGASGIPYTFSIWVKSFDGVSNYTMHIISPTGATTMVDVTGTWNRVSVTANASGSSVGYGIGLRGGMTPTNSNTADILVWGAQLEQRSSVTAYTATTTQAITNYIPVLQTAASGVPRFDHNPITDESLGLLIEEQRTNLLTYSSDYTNAAWGAKTGLQLTVGAIAPDGTTSLKVESTASGTRFLAQSATTVASTAYTATAYLKKNTTNFGVVSIVDGSNQGIWTFDLNAGTVGQNVVSTLSSTATITSVGNGWYRCSVTATASTTSLTMRTYPVSSASVGSSVPYEAVFIWGAQFEAGAFATSYIPTVAASVTRNADAASMTGTSFSSWYNAGEGTLLFNNRYLSTSVSSNAGIEIYNTDVANTAISFRGSRLGLVQVNGVSQAVIGVGGVLASSNSQALVYRTDDFAISYNGSAAVTDTSGIVPVVNAFRLNVVGSFYPNGTISKIAYYPIRVTNAQLQGLTTV
jgi:hypothetical protein